MVTTSLLRFEELGSWHRASRAKVHGGVSKLDQHAAPDRLETPALRWRQVFR
jgi:hypothetical protein